MTPQQDIRSLWDLYEDTLAQLQEIQAEKHEVLAALATLRSGGQPDFASIGLSGKAGAESYSMATVQARFDSLCKAEVDLGKLLYEQRMHAVKAEPGIRNARVRNHNDLNL